MDATGKTSFSTIYDSFSDRVTDEMYMELTELDTYEILQDLLINSISRFEFPRFDIYDYELGYIQGDKYKGILTGDNEMPCTYWVCGFFNHKLTQEEINILALNMVIEWLGQQLTTTENTEMKYSGSDFKFTSQANHMAKLKVMIDAAKQDSLHMQRLYKRRKVVNGQVRSTASLLMETPTYGYKIGGTKW